MESNAARRLTNMGSLLVWFGGYEVRRGLPTQQASLEPSRDDRGVSVAIRNAFDGAVLSAAARERLVALGQVAKAHPDFPVLVVVHGAKARATPADVDRASTPAQTLREAGASRIETKAVGDALPVAIPGHDAKRNERVEVVFVAPAR